jgi:hypothetical protein
VAIAEPRKARFPAEPKMRPNEVLKSLLYLLILCKWKYYMLSLFQKLKFWNSLC